MHEPAPPYNLKNAAWVVVPTRLPPQALLSFCRDVERLFRLNPFLKITAWHQQNKSDYSIEWENHSNVRPIYLSTQLKLEVADNALQLRYSTGIKDKTHFIVEQAERGSRLIIVDDYGDSDQRDVEQVDKSLTAWGRTLASFFAGYRMLKNMPWADQILDRWWIRLSPTGRRVVYILLVITAVELIALLLFGLLYWLA